MIRKTIIATAALLAFAAPAYAEPAQIDDGQSPRDAGAEIKDGSGTVGYDFSEPGSKPYVSPAPDKPGKDATEEEKAEYAKAKEKHDAEVAAAEASYRGSEYARLAAKAYRECIAAGKSLC